VLRIRQMHAHSASVSHGWTGCRENSFGASATAHSGPKLHSGKRPVTAGRIVGLIGSICARAPNS
jgi:hypothetical protein